MKRFLILILIALAVYSLSSCEPSTRGEVKEEKARYLIKVDDGLNNGILSVKTYKATDYIIHSEGRTVKIYTTDGKSLIFTNHLVTIKEL
jgi:hypothetical protein